jgi:hypothetical protein
MNGDRTQQTPEVSSWANATGALPVLSDTSPPTPQPIAPAPMIRKDHSGTLRPAPVAAAACAVNTTGTNAQNA